jgi:hypothetical protein
VTKIHSTLDIAPYMTQANEDDTVLYPGTKAHAFCVAVLRGTINKVL